MSNVRNNAGDNQSVDDGWGAMRKIGGVAAILMVVLIPFQSFVFIAFPPPKTALEFFALFQASPFKGLLDLDLLLIINNILLIFVYLALWAVLKKTGKSLMTIALTLGLIGITLLLVSREATFGMLGLSAQYADASSEAQRNMIETIGRTVLASYNGGVFDMSYVLGAIPLLITAAVMRKNAVFGKGATLLVAISGVLMLIPPTVGTIGIAVSLLSLIPTMAWLVMVGIKLVRMKPQPE